MSERDIKDFNLDESIDYILNSLKHTQYNQDAQDYFAKVIEHIKNEMKDDIVDLSEEETVDEYDEEVSCHIEDNGKIEIPLLKYEDGLKQAISAKEKDGFERIHNWDEYTREVLNNILIAIENKQHLGYFDSIIDLETNCNLINLARDVYINQFNEDGSRFKNPKTRITKEDIDKQCRGGYSVEFKERMYKLLVNEK